MNALMRRRPTNAIAILLAASLILLAFEPASAQQAALPLGG